jgi:hypothetical protein
MVPSKLPAAENVNLTRPGLVQQLFFQDWASCEEGLTDPNDGRGASNSMVVGLQLGALDVEPGEAPGNLVPSKLPTVALL